MKKILMALGGVLLLIGITVGVLKWQQIGPFRSDAVTAQEEQPYEPPDLGDKPTFISVDPIIIPIFKDDEVVGNIQFAVKLEVGDSDAYRIVTQRQAKLVDAYLRDLYVYIPRYLMRAAQVDLVVVKERLVVLTDKIMGAGVVERVLIAGVMDNQPKNVPKK